MYVIKDNVIKLSVRGLVEFICRSGDIDNRTGGFSDVRLMQEGAIKVSCSLRRRLPFLQQTA